MTSLHDLELAYQQHLKNNIPVSSSGQANDAFEIYALSLVLTAAQQEGATIFLKPSIEPLALQNLFLDLLQVVFILKLLIMPMLL